MAIHLTKAGTPSEKCVVEQQDLITSGTMEHDASTAGHLSEKRDRDKSPSRFFAHTLRPNPSLRHHSSFGRTRQCAGVALTLLLQKSTGLPIGAVASPG